MNTAEVPSPGRPGEATTRSPTICIPFLASDPEQFDPSWPQRGFGVEASLFDRHDLESEKWDRVRDAVRRIAHDHAPPAFVFHFPVNDSDYLADPFVDRRVHESLELVAECGMNGMVLHSNRIRDTKTWQGLDLERERDRFARYVERLRQQIAGARFWVGLENMPAMGNDARETDPLLVFPGDFQDLVGGNIGITWDHCHFSYSVHVAELVAAGKLRSPERYTNLRAADYLDFEQVSEHIVHHHFAAFRGPSIPEGDACVEGMPPWAGTVPEDTYARILSGIARSHRAWTVTLEIQEHDYRNRSTVFDVAAWCRRRLPDGRAAHG